MTDSNNYVASIFSHPGWTQYIEETQDLKSRIFEYGQQGLGSTSARVHAFVDQRGRLRMPKLQPYLSVAFRPTPVETARKLESQWIEASTNLAEEMREVGYMGTINLDSSIRDVRAWQVTGLHAEVKYTYHILLPFDPAQTSNAVRKNIRKADRAGLTSGRTSDIEAVIRCLNASERRQGFEYRVSAKNLHRMQALLGPNMVRLYACRDASGNVISARVLLVSDSAAVDWVAGTNEDALNIGSTQQLIRATLEDIGNDGVELFDFGGANIPSVARSKLEWGGTLTPFYVLRPNNPKTLAIDGRRWLMEWAKKARGGKR